MMARRTFTQIGRKLKETGFFHIVGTGTLNKALGVLLSIILVRLLTKDDYGLYAYANNLISILALFNGLGVTSAILQICSELHGEPDRANSFYAFGYARGALVDCCLGAGILLVACIAPLALAGSNQLLALYSFYPLVLLLYDIKLTGLRVKLMNREYAWATNLQTLALVALSCIGARFFQATGLIVGQSLSYLLVYMGLCIRFPDRGNDRATLDRADKKDFWNISLISAVNNGLSAALALVGTFFVGLLLADDALVAEYQVATMVPFGLLFIPSAVMTYLYPHFAQHHGDGAWTKRSYRTVLFGSIALYGLIAMAIGCLAGPIVLLLFGQSYESIVPVLRLLLVGFFLNATLRQLSGNLLVTQRKLLTNTIIGVLSIAISIASNILLIPAFGMMGAALAYDVTMLFGAIAGCTAYLHVITHLP